MDNNQLTSRIFAIIRNFIKKKQKKKKREKEREYTSVK